jgi:uroporphyrinogen decarboxylase
METAGAIKKYGGKPIAYNPKAQSLLESLYGDPTRDEMSPYERVQAAVERRQGDRVPFDFWAVPEVSRSLQVYLGAENEEQLLQLLGIDCRIVAPDYIGPEPQRFADGSYFTQWGDHRILVSNPYSTYEEYASYPLAEAKSVAEVRSWPNWPKSDYWDWRSIIKKIRSINSPVRYHIRYEVGGIFESAWALYGLEHFLADLVDQPEVPCAIMDAYTDLMIENVHRLIRAAPGWIDMVYTFDDVAMQTGLLMSPGMWREYILPRHKRLNKVIKSYGLKILYHSCGGIAPLIGALVDEMGIDVLNPLQPRPAGMDMAKIKANFGDRLAFHGGIDLQQTMTSGSPEDVRREVFERIKVLGAGGGYICSTAHNIQADTPVENILALYTAPRAFS